MSSKDISPERRQISARTLKIEAGGDHWKGGIKPKIRLSGKWLEHAGFVPGEHVQVIVLKTGLLHICAFSMLEAYSKETIIPMDLKMAKATRFHLSHSTISPNQDLPGLLI